MGDEIKSTLEIVMEKVEKLGKASKDELEKLKLKEEAQRLVGKFLTEEDFNLGAAIEDFLKDKSPEVQKEVFKVVVSMLLKNIVLPYTKYQLEDGKKAIEGLSQVFKKAPEILRLCEEIKKLLETYHQHKETIYQQLVERFNAGIEALEQAISNQMGTEVKINVEEHPQFKEEWGKIKEQLDREYGKQLEYLKNLFEKIIA
ncbi:MAG: hypothetical protein GXO57_06780 [Thermodesulfobacteria bacterium]|nr:hypothetical protein [Thermodesulfobacteriota bacterium]